MTKSTLTALVTEAGGPECIVGLMFDNSSFVVFNEDEIFSLDNLITIGGEDFYRRETRMQNKMTGRYDIKTYNYHPLECLQGVQAIADSNDLKKIDPTELYIFGT